MESKTFKKYLGIARRGLSMTALIICSIISFGIGVVSSSAQWDGVSYYQNKFNRDGVLNLALNLGFAENARDARAKNLF